MEPGRGACGHAVAVPAVLLNLLQLLDLIGNRRILQVNGKVCRLIQYLAVAGCRVADDIAVVVVAGRPGQVKLLVLRTIYQGSQPEERVVILPCGAVCILTSNQAVVPLIALGIRNDLCARIHILVAVISRHTPLDVGVLPRAGPYLGNLEYDIVRVIGYGLGNPLIGCADGNVGFRHGDIVSGPLRDTLLDAVFLIYVEDILLIVIVVGVIRDGFIHLEVSGAVMQVIELDVDHISRSKRTEVLAGYMGLIGTVDVCGNLRSLCAVHGRVGNGYQISPCGASLGIGREVVDGIGILLIVILDIQNTALQLLVEVVIGIIYATAGHRAVVDISGMPVPDMGVMSEDAVILHAAAADSGIGLGLGIRKQICDIAILAVCKASAADSGTDETCRVVVTGRRLYHIARKASYLDLAAVIAAYQAAHGICVVGSDLAVRHIGVVHIGIFKNSDNTADVCAVAVNVLPGSRVGADFRINDAGVYRITDDAADRSMTINQLTGIIVCIGNVHIGLIGITVLDQGIAYACLRSGRLCEAYHTAHITGAGYDTSYGTLLNGSVHGTSCKDTGIIRTLKGIAVRIDVKSGYGSARAQLTEEADRLLCLDLLGHFGCNTQRAVCVETEVCDMRPFLSCKMASECDCLLAIISREADRDPGTV